jgi:hypothetical protein
MLVFPSMAFLTLCAVAMLHAVPWISMPALLRTWGVPALSHPFMDLHGVMSWCELFRAGGDPALQETVIIFPGEAPYPNFRMNYSPVVFLLSYMGLHSESVPVWGALLAALYLISVWVLACPMSLKQSLFWIAVVFSPASALVMERGNLDTMVFAMLAGALLLRNWPPLESGLILASSTMKFFPIAAMLAPWLGGRRGARIAAAGATLIFILLLTMLTGRLGAIATSLGSQDHTAFGAVVPACLLRSAAVIGPEAGVMIGHLFKAAAWVLGIGFFLFGFLRRDGKEGVWISERSRHAFLLGAPVYFLLFLSGNQMDYKVIFLFFMIPAMLELRCSEKSFLSTAATFWIALLGIYSYWTFFSDEGSLRNALLKQVVMWGVFCLGGWLAGKILSQGERTS